MSALAAAVRWDVALQARSGFYWASAFLLLVVGALLLALPAEVRAERASLVPAILAVNLQITTFFFMAGLMLLDRDEGTLAALAVSPLTPAGYLAARTLTLTGLAVVETGALVAVAFGPHGSWPLLLAGAAALGAIYTGFGAAVAARYRSVNALLLPASVFVTLLLLPLLPHFGLLPRGPFLLHPLEPPLALLRAGYGGAGPGELAYGALGSLGWGWAAFAWGGRRVAWLMRETAGGAEG